MQLEVILSVVIAIWVVATLVVISLCHAAKRGDDPMDVALADAISGGWGPEFTERSLRTLSLDDAASLLEVSPETLQIWDQRYGFPTSSASGLRYNQFEVLALRDSLEDGLSIASAVNHARERTRRRRPASPPGLIDHRGGGLAS